MTPTTLGVLLKGIAQVNNEEVVIKTVVTDSRKVTEGSLFVAIVGENLDGHDYLEDAFVRGAAAALVSKKNDNISGTQIVVGDTKNAHILIGKNYIEQFSPLVVGVTGSVGKTTTKEMISLILATSGDTVKNEGNLNNEIGLPQTMFEIGKDTKFAVLEMGMNNLGDIRKLTMAAKPYAAVITTIGIAHIEFLKTRENILKAKLEILEGMPQDGIVAINGDDKLLLSAKDTVSQKCVTFAIENTDSDVIAKNIIIDNNLTKFVIADKEYGDYEVILPALGNHNVLDALSAYAITTRIGISPTEAPKALSNYQPTGMRQNIVNFKGITVIEDCYNANPDSMNAALGALSIKPVKGIRIAVLGDMLELGEYTEKEHRNLVMYAASCGIDVLLCIGDNMKVAVEAAQVTSISSVKWFSNKEELADCLVKTVKEDDLILFKASRGIKLEDVLQIFYERYV